MRMKYIPTIMDSQINLAPGVGNEPGRHVPYVHTLHWRRHSHPSDEAGTRWCGSSPRMCPRPGGGGAPLSFGTLRSLLPEGFAAYARIFHPAYLNKDEERPVRWSTVASWTGRTIHPLMQFERIAGLSEDAHDMYKGPPWGSLPKDGSIPERECRTLVEVLRSFTSTPGQLLFLPLERLWKHRHSPLQGEFSGESSGAGLPAIPRAYRCNHGIPRWRLAFLGALTKHLVAGG